MEKKHKILKIFNFQSHSQLIRKDFLIENYGKT